LGGFWDEILEKFWVNFGVGFGGWRVVGKGPFGTERDGDILLITYYIFKQSIVDKKYIFAVCDYG